MPSTPPPVPTTTPGFVVLDAELPDRPPLGHAEDYDAARYVLAAVQEEFYDQLDANGEGGHTAQLALVLAPIDATGTIGPPCYWATINGMRPAER
jgi:hypothetical protein